MTKDSNFCAYSSSATPTSVTLRHIRSVRLLKHGVSAMKRIPASVTASQSISSSVSRYGEDDRAFIPSSSKKLAVFSTRTRIGQD
uniref:Uncharacterized protein n=1 Tax=Triticum urartu TaxID=4572 RepID=A0A8R7JV54_TRIUA